MPNKRKCVTVQCTTLRKVAITYVSLKNPCLLLLSCAVYPPLLSNSLQFLSHFYALEGEIFMGFLDPKMQLEVGGVVYENWGFLILLFILVHLHFNLVSYLLALFKARIATQMIIKIIKCY